MGALCIALCMALIGIDLSQKPNDVFYWPGIILIAGALLISYRVNPSFRVAMDRMLIKRTVRQMNRH